MEMEPEDDTFQLFSAEPPDFADVHGPHWSSATLEVQLARSNDLVPHINASFALPPTTSADLHGFADDPLRQWTETESGYRSSLRCRQYRDIQGL